MFPLVRAIALLSLVSPVLAQPVAPFGLRLEPALREGAAATDAEGRPLYGRGDDAGGRAGQDLTLTGNAELRRAGTAIRGERLTYWEDDDQLVGNGQVRVIQQGNVFEGPELSLKLDANEGFFRDARFSLPAYGGVGRASEIRFEGPTRLRLLDAIYTTCRPDNPDWWLEADSLLIDETEESATGRRARLIFKNRATPLVPGFSFPLGNARRTGLLTPSFFVSSRTGPEFLAPFYWNIAPNRDLTLYPKLLLRRGVQLGAEFRYLEPRSFGTVRAEFLPSDPLSTGLPANSDRWFFGLDHTFLNVGGWSGRAQLRRVSDDIYFSDFARTLVAASERSLPADLTASRALNTPLGPWTLTTQVVRWQNILEARLAPPYDRLPSVVAVTDQRDLPGGIDVTGRVEATRFARTFSPTPEGWRFVANPTISRPFVAPGWFVVPKLGLHASRYSLDLNPSAPGNAAASVAQPLELSRVVPTFSLDAGLVFERPFEWKGKAFTQTLEPRLFYARTPFRDQSEFPVFDSGLASFNFAQIFSENRFVGQDRIADVNALTTAAVSRFLDEDGRERLRTAIGQRLSFSEPRVTLPFAPVPTDRRSDLLLAAAADLGGGSFLDAGLQYGVRGNDVPRANISWRWWPSPTRLLNLGYRYAQNLVHQADVSWRWPIAQRWLTMGRLNYSFLEQRNLATGTVIAQPGIVESVAGVEYLADCWTFRVALQRYVTGALNGQARPNTVFFVQLELAGVGRIGNDLFGILRRNIPGYTLATDGAQMRAPSSYLGYE